MHKITLFLLGSLFWIAPFSAQSQSTLKPLVEDGDYTAAISAYEAMDTPDEYDFYFAAIAYRGIDSLDLAIKSLKRAENSGYKRYDFYFLKGILFTEQKMWVAAAKAFENAQYLDPKKKAAYYEAAGAHYQLGEWKEARENYEKLLVIYPKEGLALYMQCALSYEEEFYKEAYSCYSKNLPAFKVPSKYHAKSLRDLIKISWQVNNDYASATKWWSLYDQNYSEDWAQAILKESFYWQYKEYEKAELQSQKIRAAADQLPPAVVKSGKYLAASVETKDNYFELYREIKTGNWILFKLTPSGFSAIDKYESQLVDDQWEFTSERYGTKVFVKNSLEIIHLAILEGKF